MENKEEKIMAMAEKLYIVQFKEYLSRTWDKHWDPERHMKSCLRRAKDFYKYIEENIS